MQKLVGILLATAVTLIWLPTRGSAQCTGQVYKLNVSFNLGIQEENDLGGDVIHKTTVNYKKLVNVAVGRATTAPVPANEVLAFIGHCDCDAPHRLVVWDTNSQTVLATIAEQVQGAYAESPKAGVSAELFEIQSGDGFNSGYLSLASSYKMNTSTDCVATFNSKVTGLMNATFENDEGNIVTMDLLVLGGTISAKAPPIGIVVEP